MGVRGAAGLVALVLLCGCNAESTPQATTTAPVTTASPTTELPRAIPLPPLPAEGVVVESGGRVAFRSLDGRRSVPLPGFHLRHVTGSSAYLTSADGASWVLDTSGKSAGLVREEPSYRFTDGQDLLASLPPAQKAGHWEFALTGPGGQLLAQWSGECETPAAYLVDVRHHLRELGPKGKHVESYARGWSRAGLPVIEFPQGACGSGLGKPGLYVETSPARYRLVAAATLGAYYRLSHPEPAPPPCSAKDFLLVAGSQGATGDSVLGISAQTVSGRRCFVGTKVLVGLRRHADGRLLKVDHNPITGTLRGELPVGEPPSLAVVWGAPYCPRDQVDLVVQDALGHRVTTRNVLHPRCDHSFQHGVGPGLSLVR